LGLVGILTSAGCGGSSKSTVDAKPAPDGAVLTPDGSVIVPDGPVVPAGGLTVLQPTVNFGSVDQGGTATKPVTVTNTGIPAAVSPQVVGTGYTIQTTTCTGVLATNASCVITIAFSPAVDASGGASGVLTLGAGTGAITVSLSATVTAPGSFAASLSIIPATAMVNQAIPFTVTVTPVGALTGLSCLPSGTDLSVDTVTPTTCAPVPAGSCVYAFVFKAAKAGAATDKVVCSSAGTVKELPISVTVLSPASLTISPTPGASFAVVVGGTSDPITFTVRNNGTAPSGTLAAALGGTGAASFAMTDNQCSTALAGSPATCTIKVVYKPTAAGVVSATLTVTDATVGSTPVSATLSGSAVVEGFLTIAGPQNLGDTVTVGQSSAAATFTVSNGGGTDSDLVKVATTDAQFTINNDLCSGLPLAVGKTCTFTVTFSPASPGLKTTVLAVSSGLEVQAQKQIQGTGVAAPTPAVLSMSPATLDFGTIGVGMTVGPKTFTVTNSGGTATGLLSVVKLDSSSSVGAASGFTYTSTCAPSLAPLGTCTVSVTFAPTIDGPASGLIRVSDGIATTLPDVGTVIGIALPHPLLTLTNCDKAVHSTRTGALETFADLGVGKTSPLLVCTLKNEGVSEQETGAIKIATTGDFAVPAASNNCTASLAAGLSCTFGLTFGPTASGQRDGTVVVSTDNRGAVNALLGAVGLAVLEVVELAPCGTAHTAACFDPNNPATIPANVVNPEPYDFGQVTVGTTSANALTLAVFVRAAVGNLNITTDFVAIPDRFRIAPDAATYLPVVVPGVKDCSFYEGNPMPTTFSDQTPLCYLAVLFTPTARVVQNGTVTVTGANSQTDKATMKGTGSGPLTIAPSPAIFTNVAKGTASDVLTLSVRNSGSVVIGPMTLTKAGTNADQFTVVEDNVTGAIVPVGVPFGVKTFGLRFFPTAVGTANATVTVSGALAGGAGIETTTVNLIGNAAVGAAMTVEISGGFADTVAGSASAPVTVTVKNAAGSLPTGHVSFEIVGGSDFTTDVTTLPLTPKPVQGTCSHADSNPVAAASNCTELIWFAPWVGSALAARSATLIVTASPGGIFMLPLTGNAKPQLSISPVGTATSPVNLTASGPSVVNGTPPSVTFTVTNNSATLVNGVVISKDLSVDGPNREGILLFDFASDVTGCNGTYGLNANGGFCTFKVSANADDLAQVGTFFAKVVATVVDNSAQVVKADVTATLVTPPKLVLTPSTNITPRDFGVVLLGNTPCLSSVKYTLANIGGTKSGPIVAGMFKVGFTDITGLQTKTSRFTETNTCGGENGLAAGSTCDITVCFNPNGTDPSDAGLTLSADLVVQPTAGLADALQMTVTGTATLTTSGPYLVDDTSPGPYEAPVNLGVAKDPNQVTTEQIALHAGSAGDFTLPIVAPLATVVGTGMGAGETVTIASGPTGSIPCLIGGTVTASLKCSLTVTWTLGSAPASGWREFTVTVGAVTMKLFGRVSNLPQLVVSRAGVALGQVLDFGDIVSGGTSQHETVVVTNIGERTTAVPTVTSSDTASIHTLGCNTTALKYMDSCTLDIWTIPQSTGPSGAQWAKVTAGTAATPNINLTWFGTTNAPGLFNAGTSETHDFLKQAVLSDTPNGFMFTFQNGVNSATTGILGIAVLDPNGVVVPDFSVDVAATQAAGTPGLPSCLKVGTLHRPDPAHVPPISGKCEVIVGFKPVALSPAAKSGTLTVTANPGGSATANLLGTAVSPLTVVASTGTLSTDGKSVDLGNVAVSLGVTGGLTVALTFTNEAGAPLTGYLTMKLSGTNASEYLVKSDTCTGAQLDGGETCVVTVLVKPTTTGPKTATVTVSGIPGDSAALILNAAATAL
jgi:hypothetical protein